MAFGDNIGGVVADRVLSDPRVAKILANVVAITSDVAVLSADLRSALSQLLPEPTMQHELGGPFRPRPKPGGGFHPLSNLSTRIGIRGAIGSGKLNAQQIATLQQAQDNGDIVSWISQEAGNAGIGDPSATPGQRDWSGFFSALGDFLVKIMPLIEQLISAFGGGVVAKSLSYVGDEAGYGEDEYAAEHRRFALAGLPAWVYPLIADFSIAEMQFLRDYITKKLGQ